MPQEYTKYQAVLGRYFSCSISCYRSTDQLHILLTLLQRIKTYHYHHLKIFKTYKALTER